MENERIMKKGNWNRVVLLILVWLSFVLSIGPVNISQAALVTYQFSGGVTGVSPSEPGFPSSLSGVAVGNTFTGSFSYDSATPSSPNPLSGNPAYASATYYVVPNTFSLTINGVPLPIGGSNLSFFLWNSNGSGNDGLKIQNTFNPSQPYYLNFGNVVLPPSTFNDSLLPTTSIMSQVLLEIRTSDLRTTYLTGVAPMLTANNPVPIPPSLLLFASGLAGLSFIRRAFKKDPSL